MNTAAAKTKPAARKMRVMPKTFTPKKDLVETLNSLKNDRLASAITHADTLDRIYQSNIKLLDDADAAKRHLLALYMIVTTAAGLLIAHEFFFR